MTVGIFQSLIIVLSICQGRQQASYCHACDIEPSRRGRRRSFRPGDHISLECFATKTASSMSPKPRRRHCPLGSSIQFP
jgi:hypothetical protein